MGTINTNIGGYTVINGKEVRINGRTIAIPKHVGRFGNNTTIINDKLYINGYELMSDDTWKRTFKAMWHQLF